GGSLAEHGGPRLRRKAVRQRLPRLTPVARAVDAELSGGRVVVLHAPHGDDVGRVRIARVEHERIAEAAGKPVPVQPLPRVARVVRPIDAAMVLLPQAPGPTWMKEQLVHALTGFGIRIREEVRLDVLILRRPRGAAVVSPER